MEVDADILAVPSAAIARFGAEAQAQAQAVVERRAEELLRAGEKDGAELWRRAAKVNREMSV
jgi:hypothetical protein